MKVHERDDVAALADDVAVVLESYRAFLVNERGLAAESVRCYLLDARVFLTQLPAPLGATLAGLSSAQVTGGSGLASGCCRTLAASASTAQTCRPRSSATTTPRSTPAMSTIAFIGLGNMLPHRAAPQGSWHRHVRGPRCRRGDAARSGRRPVHGRGPRPGRRRTGQLRALPRHRATLGAGRRRQTGKMLASLTVLPGDQGQGTPQIRKG